MTTTDPAGASGAAVRVHLIGEASDAFGGALGCGHAMDLPSRGAGPEAGLTDDPSLS